MFNLMAYNMVNIENSPVIGWFSCGATSAVACKLALSMYENVRLVYIETGSGHSDNLRFLHDCENWYGRKIEVIQSCDYTDVFDVISKRRFINSPFGAACTDVLKKRVRYKFEKSVGSWSGQVWGFDFCTREINRAIRFKQQYPDTKPLFPLIEKRLSKNECLGILEMAGIEIPKMYKLGYANNNCVGCVKGGAGYWNKIRVDFPSVFEKMAILERSIGHHCLKDVYLDELPDDVGKNSPVVPECGLFCQLEFADMIDKQANLVFVGALKMSDVK